jgi:hypothetical protein
MPRSNTIYIVSGLPRSGTSMMMKMLEAGGMELLTDHQREADEDNLLGYYELERVKKLKEGDISWLDQSLGKTVKVVSALLEHLSRDYRYKIIFMERNMHEILASQKQMLIRRGKQAEAVDDEVLAPIFERHLNQVKTWLSSQTNINVIYIDYNHLLSNPRPQAEAIVNFLGVPLDIQNMLSVPDERLYHQRRSRNNPG